MALTEAQISTLMWQSAGHVISINQKSDKKRTNHILPPDMDYKE